MHRAWFENKMKPIGNGSENLEDIAFAGSQEGASTGSKRFTRREMLGLTGKATALIAGAGMLGGMGALIGCAGASGSASDKNGSDSSASEGGPVSGDENEVIVAMSKTSEPDAGFDPIHSWGCGEHVHEPLIQSTLVTTDYDMQFVNDLATSYESSDDGMRWTFHIRDDVRFTDGELLTASDIAFTLMSIKQNPAAEMDLSMIASVQAPDETTVVIDMAYPYNALLFDLAVIGIVPEHAYDPSTYGANPIGSGRYMLAQWDRGEQVILEANPDYYGGEVGMERVVVVFMDEDASLAASLASQVDVAYTSATLVGDDAPQGYGLLNCSSVDSRGISLPCIPAGASKENGGQEYPAGNDVTCDVHLRRAINLAVDRERMIQGVLNGYGTEAYSVADAMPWYSPDMQVALDLDAAKAEMEEGGWSIGDDGIYEKDGLKAAFDLYYSADDSVRQALASEFANQMEAFGIDVTPIGSAWTHDATGIYNHQYSDPVLWGWGSNSPTQFYNLTLSTSASNYSVYTSNEVDAHLKDALATATVDESYPDWQAAQWDGVDGIAPRGASTWAWLCNVDHLYYKRTLLEVARQKPHPHGHGWSLVNNVDEWSWDV